MTYPHKDKKLTPENYLEFAVHILELGYFNPFVFRQDGVAFDRKLNSKIMIGFFNVLQYLDSCGIIIGADLIENCTEYEECLYGIFTDKDMLKTIRFYEFPECDYSDMNVFDAVIPDGCTQEDFSLVGLYLLMNTGATLNKQAIEKIIGKELNGYEMSALIDDLVSASCRKIIKRKDNSYEMEAGNERSHDIFRNS